MIRQDILKQWARNFLQDHEITTKRLILRLPRSRDAREMFALVQDPAVPRFMSFDSPKKVEHTRAHIAQRRVRCRKRESFELAVFLKSAGKLIGSISIMHISVQDGKAEMGYWLGKQYWGNGYMPEAVGALAKFAFSQLGLNKLVIRAYLENIASQRVAEKCGFEFEGLMKKDTFVKNRFWDVRYYSKLKR